MTRSLVILAIVAGSCAAQELKIVKNAPFTATSVTQTVQTLADGNKITRSTTALIARDSEGRTRREQGIVFIHDPVAKVAYVIDGRTKSARRMVVPSSDADSIQPASDRSESLGTQVIEGVQAQGTRIARTLASGEAGNESAFEIVTEAWYSSELQTAVMTKTIDPRMGEIVIRMTDIQRAEPVRSLFEVPTDYIIRDESMRQSATRTEIR